MGHANIDVTHVVYGHHGLPYGEPLDTFLSGVRRNLWFFLWRGCSLLDESLRRGNVDAAAATLCCQDSRCRGFLITPSKPLASAVIYFDRLKSSRQGHGGFQQGTCGTGLDLQPSPQLLKPFAHTSDADSDIRSTAVHFRESLG